MASNRNNDDKRGLASADPQTREKVAKMGGKAYHKQRGAKGSDDRGSNSNRSNT